MLFTNDQLSKELLHAGSWTGFYTLNYVRSHFGSYIIIMESKRAFIVYVNYMQRTVYFQLLKCLNSFQSLCFLIHNVYFTNIVFIYLFALLMCFKKLTASPGWMAKMSSFTIHLDNASIQQQEKVRLRCQQFLLFLSSRPFRIRFYWLSRSITPKDICGSDLRQLSAQVKISQMSIEPKRHC